MTSFNKLIKKPKGLRLNTLKARNVYLSPIVGNGLLEGTTDLLGGAFLQDNIKGNTSGAVFTVTAGGVTGKQVIIPAAWQGGDITWVRGLFPLSAVPKWDGFMASFASGSSTNWADFNQVATNDLIGGVLSTTIPVLSTCTETSLQAYYSYRTGALSQKGQALSGWPMLYADPIHRAALDGDCYMMKACYAAYKATGDLKYKIAADRIGNAVLDAGRWSTNRLPLAIDISAEAGQDGLYWYSSPSTPLELVTVPRPDKPYLNCLKITTQIDAGKYAGLGNWFNFNVDALTPFHSLDFLLMGDGSQRFLQLTTNIDAAKAASGDVAVIIPLLSTESDKHYPVSITPADFWKTGNVVYDASHKDFNWFGVYSSNASSSTLYEDLARRKIIRKFNWNFTANEDTGYGGVYFSAASGSSAGTSAFNFDLYSEVAGRVAITAVDALAVRYATQFDLVTGWQSLTIPWPAGFTHPAAQFSVDTVKVIVTPGYYYTEPTPWWDVFNDGVVVYVPAVTVNMSKGGIMIDNARYDSVVKMSDVAYTVVNGFEFGFPSNSMGWPYNIHLADININQTVRDGPVSSPNAYRGIPRNTYGWVGSGNTISYTSWRGGTFTGYLWLAGWTQSGIVNPDNGLIMADAMRQMLLDSQNEYHNQFPAKLIGPFVPMYGRASWEASSTGGWVAGAWTDNTLNKWYWPDTNDWYGYMMRALLSVAQDYYITRSGLSKTILDRWMTWLDVNIIADGSGWKPPSGYTKDGNPTYDYKPVYAYACIAQACIYKYWVDGDAIALKWYRRLLDDIFARKRYTGKGALQGLSKLTEGTGYSNATVIITGDGQGAAATANIHGGKITSYNIVSAGSGYSWIKAEVVAHSPIIPTLDVSAISYTSKSLLVGTQDIVPNDMTFSGDGYHLYLVGDTTDKVYQYNLTTAWDVSTASYSGKSLSVGAQDTLPFGVCFSRDGSVMLVSGDTNNSIFQYALTTPWDLATASYTGKSLDISAQDGKPRGVCFSSNGLFIYVAGYVNDKVYQYNLMTAWDLTLASYSNKICWVGALDTATGITFSLDGLRLFIVGHFNHTLYQYNLTTQWDLATASYSGKSFPMTSQDGIPCGICINPNDLSLYVVGRTNNKIYQYAFPSTGGTAYTGSGATGNAYLNDQLVGAFDAYHAGWEIAELYNTYALLVIGNDPGGTVSYPTTPTAQDITAFDGIYALYQRNKSNQRPGLLNLNGAPFHEFDFFPNHLNAGIENPMIWDTQADNGGVMWTESFSPTFLAAVNYYRYSGDSTWLDQLFSLLTEMIGEDLDLYE